jgi:hypothetical protein
VLRVVRIETPGQLRGFAAQEEVRKVLLKEKIAVVVAAEVGTGLGWS